MAGQRVPQLALPFDQLHGGKFAPGVGMGFVLGRVDDDHAGAFTQGARDALVDVVATAELLTVNKQLVLGVQVGLEITLERLDQVVLELAHVRMMAMGIADKAAVA